MAKTELRRKHPYFGKFKFKINVYNKDWVKDYKLAYPTFLTDITDIEKEQYIKVKDYLTKYWKVEKDFRWNDNWNVYLRDADVYDHVLSRFPTFLSKVIRPAPGYEDLEGRGALNEHILWYGKFSYKISLRNVDSTTNHLYKKWCMENLESDIKYSTGYSDTSFYFMNSFDAMAFKLRFGDYVKDTFIADKDEAAIQLRNRMDQAIQEYNNYMEGES